MHNTFCHELHADSVHFRYKRGPSERTDKEFHLFHEIVLFLDSEAELRSEDICTLIHPYSLLIVPKSTFHQTHILGSPEKYHRCILQFDDCPLWTALIEVSIKRLTTIEADHDIQRLFRRLMLAASTQDIHGGTLLASTLPLLLYEILQKSANTPPITLQSPFIRSVVEYINGHLSETLTVQKLAAHHYVSPSSLSHIFKREIGISPHQFILRKRLMLAHHKILSGETVTDVAIQCGFHDYANFYKRYKAFFGKPPSHK